jgi:hypothetical protein
MHQTGQSPALFKANMHPYLQAQGIIGNHGILRRYNGDIIQAKLKIGQPNDKYEQEADRAADQVMSMPEPGMQKKSTSPECEEDTDEALQTKPIADRITPIVQRQEEQEEEEEAAPENEEEEDENYLESEPTRDAGELGEEEEESVQAKSLPNKSPLVTPGLQNQIRSLKGGGQPLSKSTRAFFEPRFGRDFSQVRVHTDKRAAILAKSMNAKAFTTGKDVVFGSGQYSPETTPGKRLLAHELTHTLQQTSTKNKRMHGFKDIARDLVIQRDCREWPTKLENKSYKFNFKTRRDNIRSKKTFKVKERYIFIKIRGDKGIESGRYFFMRLFICYRKRNGLAIDYDTLPKMKIPRDNQYHYYVLPGKSYPYYYYFKIWVPTKPKTIYDVLKGDGEIVEGF